MRLMARCRMADRGRRQVLLCLTLALLAAGCGGSSSAGAGQAGADAPSTAASSPASAESADAATQQITQSWVTFFKGSTPASAKIALLQRGSSVAPVINAQAGNPLATGTAATVSAVRVTSPRRATVRYTITIDGKPALSHQSGIAVKVGDHWLVSLASFCGLLALEGTHPAACPGSGSTAGP
jgi:hypothetical protein